MLLHKVVLNPLCLLKENYMEYAMETRLTSFSSVHTPTCTHVVVVQYYGCVSITAHCSCFKAGEHMQQQVSGSVFSQERLIRSHQLRLFLKGSVLLSWPQKSHSCVPTMLCVH